MKVTVELDWESAPDDQRSGWLVFVPLPADFLDSAFESLDTAQRTLCIQCQKWEPEHITSHWDSLTSSEKGLVIQYQTLPSDFIETIWQEVSTAQQAWISLRQPLSTSFIDKIWEGLDETTKTALLLGQRLSLEHVFKKWPSLSKGQKAAAVGIDWVSSPRNSQLVEGFIEEMDAFYETVKTVGEIPDSVFPELLTSANELVRALAAGCMDRNLDKLDESNC